MDDRQRKAEQERVEVQRQADEASTFLGDILPKLWRSVYVNLIDEGFKEDQAMSILQWYILRDATHGVHFHDKG